MYLWVIVIGFFRTLHRYDVLSKNVPAMIHGGKMHFADTAGDIHAGHWEYIALYRSQVVYSNLLQSEYYTSLKAQDMTITPAEGPDKHTSYYVWIPVICNR